MSGLIDDVLDFARGRLGGGLAVESKVTGDLHVILEAMLDELCTSHPDRVILSNIAIDGNVRCDNARIAQLLSNLVANTLTHWSDDKPGVVQVTLPLGLDPI